MATETPHPRPDYWQRLGDQKARILNIRADEARSRSPAKRALVATAHALSHPAFIFAEIAFHLGWIAANLAWLPGVAPWDPTMSLLGSIASIQALVIALLILMYESYDARVEELREEVQLQVALHAERETTKLLRMVAEIHAALGIASREMDAEMEEMAQPLDPRRLKDAMEEDLREP